MNQLQFEIQGMQKHKQSHRGYDSFLYMDKKIDIIFVMPSLKHKMKEESIGTLILAKKSMLAGYNVSILRFGDLLTSPKENYKEFRRQFVTNILTQNPRILSFYCRCEEYHICIDLAAEIKKHDKSVNIVFGGPQAELVSSETLNEFPFVDYVCRSEGENTILPLLHMLIKNELEMERVDGLVYRNKDGEIVQNKLPDFLPDNFTRPFHYYDLIPPELIRTAKAIQIDVGRGCPFSCTFCSTKTFWKRKFRLRNTDDILKEVSFVIEKFNIRTFDFKHDLFTVNKNRVLAFTRNIKESGLRIKWGCDSRLDTIDTEMIDAMIESGMNQIFFGVETGSERMQYVINKKLDLRRSTNIIKYCIDKGLKVTASFIYGFPEETEDDLDKTIRMVVELQNYGVNILTNMCHILNGTDLFNRFSKELVLKNDVAYNTSIMAFDDLHELIVSHPGLFPSFYDYPSHLRDEMSFFDVYRYSLQYCYNNRRDIHNFLTGYEYGSLNMYRQFYKANQNVLNSEVDPSNGDPTHTRRVLKDMPSSSYDLLCENLKNYLLHEFQ